MNSNIVNGIDISKHTGLAMKAAKKEARNCSSSMGIDDLFQAAMMGINHAAKKFDHSLGLKFSTYASHWTRQYTQRESMNMSRTVRVPINIEFDRGQRKQFPKRKSLALDAEPEGVKTPESFLYDFMVGSGSLEECHGVKAERRSCVGALGKLGKRDQMVLEAYYVKEMSHREIGKAMGMSRRTGRVAVNDALSRARAVLTGRKTL